MKQLLRIEWLKIKNFRTFRVLALLFMILLPLWNYGINLGILKIGAGDINLLSKAYSFSYVWQNLGFWASVFSVFIAVLIIILTTNEYQYRTHRQHIIDGWTRLDFYHARWLVVLAFSLLTTVYVFLCGLVFGTAYGSFSSFPGSIIHLFYFWVTSFNYYAFALLLAIFLKRSGIAIGMLFLYAMIIESLLSKTINWGFKTNAGNYLPLQSSDELLPFPATTLIKNVMALPEGPPAWSYVLASVIWILIYYITGREKVLRSDW